MRVVSEQLSNGHKEMLGQEVSYIALTVEIDFGDGKPWVNVATGFFKLDCHQFARAVKNPKNILPTLRAVTRKSALREVSKRLFDVWRLPKDLVELVGNEEVAP